jgi:hypothetical protein
MEKSDRKIKRAIDRALKKIRDHNEAKNWWIKEMGADYSYVRYHESKYKNYKKKLIQLTELYKKRNILLTSTIDDMKFEKPKLPRRRKKTIKKHKLIY